MAGRRVRRVWRSVLAAVLACGGDVTGPEPAPQVIVSPSFVDLVLGASRQLAVTVLDENGQPVTGPALTFETSDTVRVAVSASGMVTARSPGEATITVTSEAARAYVSVRALSPAQVLLSPDTAIATIGDTLVFTAQALDFAGAPVPGAPVTFESSDPGVLTVVGPLGRVRAAGAGTARVRARSGTTADSARVRVYGVPAQIAATPDSLRLLVASDALLTIVVRDALGQAIPSAPVAFQAADTAVARVSAQGVVRAVGIGVTTVTATSGTVSDTIPVVGAAEMSLAPTFVLLTPGDSAPLGPEARDALGAVIPGVAFVFRSTDTTVARVSSTGVVTFAGRGAAFIEAAGGFDVDSTAVTAVIDLAILVAPDSLQLLVAAGAALTVLVRDETGTAIPNAPVAFASADTMVARVSTAGVVQAVGVGVTAVNVTAGPASATIPVVGTADLVIEQESVVLPGNAPVLLVAVARNAVGVAIPGVPITFTSSDTTIARVSQAGLLTYAGLGAASVTAEGGFDRDTCVVRTVVARVHVPGSAFSVATSPGDVIYVTVLDASAVSRIDPGSWSVSATVPVGLVPTDVAFDNAGARAYVTNQGSNSLSVVNPVSNTEIAQIALPAGPYVVTVAHGDSIAYVSSNSDRIFVVHLPSGIVLDSLVTGSVNAIVIRDTLLYVGLPDVGRVDVYDRRTDSLVQSLPTGGRPQGLAFSPSGAELYVADEGAGVQFWDVGTATRITTLPLPSAFDVAVQPGTGRIFVSGLGPTVYAIHPLSRAVERTFTVDGPTVRIAFRANGDGIVANEAGWVDVIR